MEKISLTEVDSQSNYYETNFTLDDYNWFQYTFEATLPVPDKDLLISLTVKYYGLGGPDVHLKNLSMDNGELLDEAVFNAEIPVFKSFMREYLTEELQHLDDKYAFYGDEITAKFYNTLVDMWEASK